MKYIDKLIWSRAELFDFFSTVDHPFYSTTFRVDVTQLHKYTKSHGISFYYALTYLVTKAINQVENFRYTIHDGKVALLEERIPSFTDIKKTVNSSILSLSAARIPWKNSAVLQKKKVIHRRRLLIRPKKATS